MPVEYDQLYIKRIRTLCKKRGITINKLATMSDVKQSTLDNIIRGVTKNPRMKTIHKVATAFNMTLSEFLDFDELNAYSFEDESEE
ncbi:MAG: helix-turn-helix transcriptional regulator [Clostridia bacterium]|nr:helix-turn-helix transcriptional regulator [Clostridia bacterium]